MTRFATKPPNASKYYWIDSICIDQTDVHGRSHQMGLMKIIHRGAELVIPCIGP
ncbi:hypothetical protein K504DRAFT_367605, partial [Pleomassaria siparia CBS 279.74]